MRLSENEKEILREIVNSKYDYDYFINFLSNQNKAKTKEYLTIKSVLKYKLKEAILLKKTDLKLWGTLEGNTMLVIEIDDNCDNIRVPKDWFNVYISYEKHTFKFAPQYNEINKDFTLVEYHKYHVEPKITFNSMYNIQKDMVRGDLSRLGHLILEGTIQIIDKLSLLEYISEYIEIAIADTHTNFMIHIVRDEFSCRRMDLSFCVMLIYKYELVKRYRKEFEALDYKVYLLYNESRNRLLDAKTEELSSVIMNTAIAELKKLYTDTVNILNKEIEYWKQSKV